MKTDKWLIAKWWSSGTGKHQRLLGSAGSPVCIHCGVNMTSDLDEYSCQMMKFDEWEKMHTQPPAKAQSGGRGES